MWRGIYPRWAAQQPPKAQCDQHGTTRCLRSGRETSCPHSLCGSGLARESVGAACIRTECTPASKPTPTSNLGCSQILHPTQLPCGSLLAMTPAKPPVARSLLPLGCAAVAKPDNAVCLGKMQGPATRASRSKPPPQGLVSSRISSPTPPTVGAGLLAKAADQLASVLNVSPRATAHTSNPGCSQILHPTQLPCGSELAHESGGSACISAECIPRATAHTSNPGCSQILHPTQLPCGSELARESGRSACINIECATLFASKLANTGRR